MRVMVGWSGEIGSNRWAKSDIELDENDLQRLGEEIGFDPTKLTIREAYQLLRLQAEVYVVEDMLKRGASNVDELTAQVQANNIKKSDILSRLVK